MSLLLALLKPYIAADGDGWYSINFVIVGTHGGLHRPISKTLFSKALEFSFEQ